MCKLVEKEEGEFYEVKKKEKKETNVPREFFVQYVSSPFQLLTAALTMQNDCCWGLGLCANPALSIKRYNASKAVSLPTSASRTIHDEWLALTL